MASNTNKTPQKRKPRKRKPPPPGLSRRSSELERERRCRIVEYCISIGRTSRREIQTEFREQGINIVDRTIDSYIAEVKKRLVAEDDKVRAARRVQLNQALYDREQMIVERLTSSGVSPQWRDLVNILKLRVRLLEKGYVDELPPPIVHEEDQDEGEGEGEELSLEEIDERIKHLMLKGGLPTSVASKKPEDTVH